MRIPAAIIFLNSDLTYPPILPIPRQIGADPSLYIGANSSTAISELTNFQRQLHITDTISKTEFDARIVADPSYPRIVHIQNLRVLVLLPNFQDCTNRNLADIVIFVKQGIVSVERHNEPRFSVDMQCLNIWELLRAEPHCERGVVCVPCAPCLPNNETLPCQPQIAPPPYFAPTVKYEEHHFEKPAEPPCPTPPTCPPLFQQTPQIASTFVDDDDDDCDEPPHHCDCGGEYWPFRWEGAFGFECNRCHRRDERFWRWIPENQPGKPPHDPEEGL